MWMTTLQYNCIFALLNIFRLHKLDIEAHAYAHYTSCFALLCLFNVCIRFVTTNCMHTRGVMIEFFT